MDGVSEESPLLQVILLWDKIDYVFHAHPLLLLFVGLTIAYAIFASSFDRSSLLAILLLLNRTVVFAFLRDLVSTKTWPWACGTAVVALATLGATRQNLTRSHKVTNARSYLIPCRTTHTRMFPEKHSFAYSYLLVGVPVTLEGNVNGMISTNTEDPAWYNIDAADYLERGFGHRGLRGKLEDYLGTQDIDPTIYPHAYLITAPKFLGYHFNPVSFWYLYSQDRVLSAIILEVNNTFGERRPYLVTRDGSNSTVDSSYSDLSVPRAKVTGSWAKDFHVSPFNSRKGSYSLLAKDLLGENMVGFQDVDITINLGSSKGHPKLVARLFSEGQAIDPELMGLTDKLKFILGWFWVGFVTFPRIAKEAGVLFFKKHLHVWYRPEPLNQSLGRNADAIEESLESVFRDYLKHLVEHSHHPVVVRYIPGGLRSPVEETISSPTAKLGANGDDGADRIHIKVLTPAFYSRFVRYTDDVEAILSEMNDSHTLWVENLDVLRKVFTQKGPQLQQELAFADFLRFNAIRLMRRKPDIIKRPMTSAEVPPLHDPAERNPQVPGLSPLDIYVLNDESERIKVTYRTSILQLFLADFFTLGSIELLTLMEYALRVSLSWSGAYVLQSFAVKLWSR